MARGDMENTIRKWNDTSGIRTGGGGIGSTEGGSAVFVEPGAGVGTCGLTCEVFLAGIIVGCLYKSCSNAPVSDGTRDVCMDDVHDPSSQDICKIGGMTFYLDLETT